MLESTIELRSMLQRAKVFTKNTGYAAAKTQKDEI